MELDELKSAWQSLDQRLETSNRLQMQAFRERKLDQLNRRLRPLYWGQVVQVVIGTLVLLSAIAFWSSHRHEVSMLLSGIVVHVYGVVMIMTAGITLGRVAALDYSAPVMALQKQLGSIRRFHILGGLWAGLPWWFLWMPIMAVLVKSGTGVNMYENAPLVFFFGTIIGLLGLAVTWAFHRWSLNPRHPHRAKAVEDSVTGKSLRSAQAVLDEIAAFEKD
jgi:hypothetical protein